MSDTLGVDEMLKTMGLERTRANWIWVLWGGETPETWDEDEESIVPEDLRLSPAPDEPFPPGTPQPD